MIVKINEVSPITGKVSARYINTDTISFFEFAEVRSYEVISIALTNGLIINAIASKDLAEIVLGNEYKDCTVNVETAKGQES